MQPIYFGAVIWGKPFHRMLVDVCLVSLATPGNLTGLDAADGHRFLVATPAEEWPSLMAEPLVRKLSAHLTFERLPFEKPEADGKMAAMSRGHKLMAERMHRDRALGVYVYPDTVFSGSVIERSVEHIHAGAAAVLAYCPRFASHHFVERLLRSKRLSAENPQSLSPRELVREAIACRHVEMQRCEWTSGAFDDLPVTCYWLAPGGMVALSLIWYPVMINYAALPDHDTTTLDSWTIDGDYVYRNLRDPSQIHLVEDSDEMVLISFTEEPEGRPDPSPELLKSLPLLGDLLKRMNLRAFLHTDQFDPLKHAFFQRPIMMRQSDAPGWEQATGQARRIAEDALNPLSPGLRRWLRPLRILNDGPRKSLGWWLGARLGGDTARARSVLGALAAVGLVHPVTVPDGGTEKT